MKDWDVSMPREHAERRLNCRPGSLSLDELARRMSLVITDEPVSVRDPADDIHSRAYVRGVVQNWMPYFVEKGIGQLAAV